MSIGNEPLEGVLPHERDDVLPHEDTTGEEQRELAEKRPRRHTPPPAPRPYSRSGIGIGFSRNYELIRKALVWVAAAGVLYVHVQCCGFVPMVIQLAWEAGGAGLAAAAGTAWALALVVGPIVLAFAVRRPLAEWLGQTGLSASYRRMTNAITRSFRVTAPIARRVGIVFGVTRRHPPGEYEEYLGLLELRANEMVLWWARDETVGVFTIPRSAVTHFGRVEHWYDVHQVAVPASLAPVAPLIGYADEATGKTLWFSLESGDEVAPARIAAATEALHGELERWLNADADSQG